MRRISKLIGLAAIVASAASCGTAVREGQSPVYLVINQLLVARGSASNPTYALGPLTSDVYTVVTNTSTCTIANPCPTIFSDLGQVVLSLSLKNIGSAGPPNTPTSNNAVTISRYHVQYRRADGRNTQGVDVPYAFDGAATGTVPVTGTLSVFFTAVRSTAKEESPLIQLVTSSVIITAIADVTFYGTDQVGNQVIVTGSFQVDFGNFGDF
ncbi:MAG: hypothetical protein HY047_12195 [Acidobacteria bacterium]|nr:hypothetical protein [Acidobacteriota bacterium]